MRKIIFAILLSFISISSSALVGAGFDQDRYFYYKMDLEGEPRTPTVSVIIKEINDGDLKKLNPYFFGVKSKRNLETLKIMQPNKKLHAHILYSVMYQFEILGLHETIRKDKNCIPKIEIPKDKESRYITYSIFTPFPKGPPKWLKTIKPSCMPNLLY